MTAVSGACGAEIDYAMHVTVYGEAEKPERHSFCRIHQTLRVTPAMAAGVTDHAREIADLVALLG